MQLKLKRSQRAGGALGGTVIFCLDVRVDLTPEEQQSVGRYKLGSLIVYQSEAKKRAQERGASAAAGAQFAVRPGASATDWFDAATSSLGGGMKALAFGAMAALSLKITVNSLQQGQHIECKSLDELMGAEEAVMAACRNLRSYLDTASAFDGREIVVDFNGAEGVVVASATPAPALAMSGPSVPPPGQAAATMPASLAAASEAPAYQAAAIAAEPDVIAAIFDDLRGMTSLAELQRPTKIALIAAALVVIFSICSLLHVFILVTVALMVGCGFVLTRILRL